MKKIAILFVLGVFIPALVLGVLALQSARQQGVLIADQEAKLRQQEADNVAAQVALSLRIEHETFVKVVEGFLLTTDPEALSKDFNRMLAEKWKRKSVGFCVSTEGRILSPVEDDYLSRRDSLEFIEDNAAFLKGRVSAEVYATTNESLAEVKEVLQQSRSSKLFSQADSWAGSSLRKQKEMPTSTSEYELRPEQQKATDTDEKSTPKPEAAAAPAAQAVPVQEGQAKSLVEGSIVPGPAENTLKDIASSAEPAKRKADSRSDYNRNVAPQNIVQNKQGDMLKLASNLNVATSRFSELVAKDKSGILSRFVNDRLEILFWVRPANRPDLVFGARILPEDIRDVVAQVLSGEGVEPGVVVTAILDDRTKPFIKSDASFNSVWENPFVAAEVGEVLPHWEVGLYLRDTGRLSRTATLTSYTIMGLIALALGAIAVGGGLIVMDMRRQLVLVKKKTDFVSNVSHELKTPLTSIRMFAELLQQESVSDPEKRSHYLRIITLEAERLTRLINNVLDFARMERNQKNYEKEDIDLHEVIRRVWESQELHLNQLGFQTCWKAEEAPYPVHADADALAQILVNLLSNAEKYSGEAKEVELHSYKIDGQVRVAVLDRGVGVPVGEEKKIFEHFYRAHDSLSSGIQGSGLGLTLARKIAMDHGGNITCEARKEGGTRFTLHLPLIKSKESNTL